MRYLYLWIIFMVLSGCATEIHRLQSAATPLTQDSSFYVPRCADGLHDGHKQVASGLMTSQLLSSELKTHARHVENGSHEENLSSALVSARDRDLMYVAYPSILDWQNEATPMASVPDKVKVRIDIVDVASANVIDAVVLEKQTSEMASSKTPPQELLTSPVKEYVGKLFRKESQQSFWHKMYSLLSNDNREQ
jgi:hypothetical protein